MEYTHTACMAKLDGTVVVMYLHLQHTDTILELLRDLFYTLAMKVIVRSLI
jgi:hypothetical protein